jgi:hypothetical protein
VTRRPPPGPPPPWQAKGKHRKKPAGRRVKTW